MIDPNEKAVRDGLIVEEGIKTKFGLWLLETLKQKQDYFTRPYGTAEQQSFRNGMASGVLDLRDELERVIRRKEQALRAVQEAEASADKSSPEGLEESFLPPRRVPADA